MRRIDDMLRMISLDELNGGVTMKDKNTYTVIPEAEAAPKITERKQAAAVKSRKASFAVAAALVLVIGGGALVLSFAGNKSVTPGTADSISVTSDAEAEDLYRVILANISARIEDGLISEVRPGGYTVDLAAADGDVAKLLALTYSGYAETMEHFKNNTQGITEIPKSGKVFYHISEKRKVDFVQYRSADGMLGQFPTADTERTEFGVVPESLNVSELTAVDTKGSIHAHAFYDIFNRMQMDCFNSEYPTNREWALLPGGNLLVLDLEKRDSYADVISRMENYNAENILFTGKLFINYEPGNGTNYVAWQAAEGGLMEVWFKVHGASLFNPGDIPDNDAAWALNQATSYALDPRGTVPATINCQNISGEGVNGVITSRQNMQPVFEWYEKFLSANYEPVAFDPNKKIASEKIGRIISFGWVDMEIKKEIFIRTSDMVGANIYVNGRYYNIEDTSVLNLLDNGMPEPISKKIKN